MRADVQRIQRQLIALQLLASGEDDGVFGQNTLTAANRFLTTRQLPPLEPPYTPSSIAGLTRVLFPEDAAKPPSPFNLGTLLSLYRLLKGQPMTSDQVGGLVRAILTFLAGIAVARGWVDNATALTIVGGLVTVLTAAWSVFTNRPAKIAK